MWYNRSMFFPKEARMYRILLVEDDEGIAQAVRQAAEVWGLQVAIVEDFHDVMAEYAAWEPHLVLLDICLPFYDGYYWCSQIRKVSKVPIIFLSSAADNMNILMAMNMGADDFIAKPFDGNILIAKVQALLRRTYDFAGTQPVLEHKGAILNLGDNTLTYGETKLSLSKNEYRILRTLMESKGKIVSRERLMERLWETDSFVDENTLNVNVNRLRKKLADIGLTDYIATKFGEGYLLS